jgi:hypothetical protein
MAFAMAESVPRLWTRFLPSGTLAARTASAGLLFWLVCVGVATAAVHPLFAAWSATQAEIRDEIDRVVPDDAVLVTNWYGTKKFVRHLDRRFAVVELIDSSNEEIRGLFDRHDVVYVVLLDRTDSDVWRAHGVRHEKFLEAIGLDRPPDSDLRPTSTDRLRIWRVDRHGK